MGKRNSPSGEAAHTGGRINSKPGHSCAHTHRPDGLAPMLYIYIIICTGSTRLDDTCELSSLVHYVTNMYVSMLCVAHLSGHTHDLDRCGYGSGPQGRHSHLHQHDQCPQAPAVTSNIMAIVLSSQTIHFLSQPTARTFHVRTKASASVCARVNVLHACTE